MVIATSKFTSLKGSKVEPADCVATSMDILQTILLSKMAKPQSLPTILVKVGQSDEEETTVKERLRLR
jgi:hypothetical protein